MCVCVCALAGRRRRGANDNLSHKERKRKRVLRGKRGEGESGNLRENESSGQEEQKKMGVWREHSVSKGEIGGNDTKSKRGSKKRMTDAREESYRERQFWRKKKVEPCLLQTGTK